MKGICSNSSRSDGAAVEGVGEVRTTAGFEEAMVGGIDEGGGGTRQLEKRGTKI